MADTPGNPGSGVHTCKKAGYGGHTWESGYEGHVWEPGYGRHTWELGYGCTPGNPDTGDTPGNPRCGRNTWEPWCGGHPWGNSGCWGHTREPGYGGTLGKRVRRPYLGSRYTVDTPGNRRRRTNLHGSPGHGGHLGSQVQRTQT